MFLGRYYVLLLALVSPEDGAGLIGGQLSSIEKKKTQQGANPIW